MLGYNRRSYSFAIVDRISYSIFAPKMAASCLRRHSYRFGHCLWPAAVLAIFRKAPGRAISRKIANRAWGPAKCCVVGGPSLT